MTISPGISSFFAVGQNVPEAPFYSWAQAIEASANFATTRFGVGAPSSSLGQDGDGYLDGTAGAMKLYGPKAAGAWPAGVAVGGGGGRTVLSAAQNYYVSTTGADTNAGTSGAPFRTIQKAVDTASALDSSIYSVVVNLANGTYAEAVTLKPLLGPGTLIILGNTGSPGSVVIAPATGSCFTASGATINANIQGMTFSTTGSYAQLTVTNGAAVAFGYVTFGNVSGNYQIQGATLARLSISGPYTIGGTAFAHFQLTAGAVLTYFGFTITHSATFTTFCVLAGLGQLNCAGVPTFSGASTGTRYTVSSNSVINTAGQTTSFLPGNAAGSLATGAQYV